MVILDDTGLPDRVGGLEIVRRIGRRVITHAIHDIDGTHSLIREWPPVMSLVLHYAMTTGLPDDFDTPENLARLVARVGAKPLPETDRYCIESAGLSAITQMEWAVRRGLEEGTVRLPGGPLSEGEAETNAEIVRRIWQGQERFPDLPESPRVTEYLERQTPRLFRLYEEVLNKASRDRNVARAREDPEAWRVPGSLALLERLHRAGVKSYFVTGAVITEADPPTGMLEEVVAVGIEVGPGKMVEALWGSTWDRKMPKDEVMQELLSELGVAAAGVLVIGDGRSEVQAGVQLGAAVMSRLPAEAKRQRELHRQLNTNYIVPDYTEPALMQLLRA